jgi:hypothetical protein
MPLGFPEPQVLTKQLVTPEWCKGWVETLPSHPDWLDRGDYSELDSGYAPDLHSLAKSEIVPEIREFFEVDVVLDYAVVFQTRVGGFMPLHADAEKQDENGKWGPNHSHWRTHVGLLYLTTHGVDHEGGVLNLPEQGLSLFPEAGQLVAFPSTHEYAHEVTPVTEGTRYALAVWTENG